MVYTLRREQILPVEPQALWHFLSRPENLNVITPPWLRFEIRSSVPERMFDGLLVRYRVRLPIFGAQDWLTEIKHIREGESFVDEQRAGPYRLWYHYHAIKPHEKGSVMHDTVTYQLPFGPIGDLVHAAIIKRQLKAIFDYRFQALDALFSAAE